MTQLISYRGFRIKSWIRNERWVWKVERLDGSEVGTSFDTVEDFYLQWEAVSSAQAFIDEFLKED